MLSVLARLFKPFYFLVSTQDWFSYSIFFLFLLQAPCGTTEGTQSRTYTVTKLPAYGGKPAPYATGYVETVACTATLKPCPVNCVGSFVDGECTAKACGSSAGTMKSVFKITTPVAYGGNKCR